MSEHVGGFATPLPSGWHWLCSCGWGTGRHESMETVWDLKAGHHRWHAHQNEHEAVRRG